MRILFWLLVCLLRASASGASDEVPEAATKPATADEDVAEDGDSRSEAFGDVVEVHGRAAEMTGVADSATSGFVGVDQLEERPLLRPAEIIEAVPGLMVTQHSGSGKANQYFLRGFNLDHGTDFRTTVEGIPVNMPSHGHGQGYTDLNFMIPELVESVAFQKGPYYADAGDFASAGSAQISYVSAVEDGLLELKGGNLGFGRALWTDSSEIGGASVLGAVELAHSDGPWERPDDFRKANGVLKLTKALEPGNLTLTAMAYHGSWNATDQVASRAVTSGLVSRFGTLDRSDGGEAERFSISADWRRIEGHSFTDLRAFGLFSNLVLFSNFTYFLDDPERGDQFEQKDRRWVAGFEALHHWHRRAWEREIELRAGLQIRTDFVGNGLFRTERRQRWTTTREDEIDQIAGGVFAEARVQWNDRFRSVFGLRGDLASAEVSSNLKKNSGSEGTGQLSPRLALIFGPWRGTELYLNAGSGFHSNDARGATIHLDPTSGEQASPVDLLVPTQGIDVGVRVELASGLRSSLALFRLDIDSELVFVGDAGGTEASRPSRRDGIDWSNFYQPSDHLSFELDLAYSRGRFRDFDPAGAHIPGSIERVASFAVYFRLKSGLSASLRWRYFGPRPLVEDNRVRSRSSSLLSGTVTRELGSQWSVSLEGYNLLNSQASDIDYYYESRLPGEALNGVSDRHFHPSEPRSVRVVLRLKV